MSVKKIPLRQCIGCGEMKSKKEMIRVIKTAEGEILLDATGRKNGRNEKETAGAGQEGGYTTTTQNLEIIKVDVENNYMLIKGNVPGPKRGLVVVKSSVKGTAAVSAKDLISYSEEAKEEE